MGDTFIISGLKEKRSDTARKIIDARLVLDKLQAELFSIDSVLRLYGVEPKDIPTKNRVPVRSAFFGRTEVSRRCYDMLREKGTIKADDVTVRAMRDKGLDPIADHKARTEITRRVLVTLHDMRKAGMVEKIGHTRGVYWKLIPPKDDDEI
jgi:ribosomal protein S19E (S16A)